LYGVTFALRASIFDLGATRRSCMVFTFALRASIFDLGATRRSDMVFTFALRASIFDLGAARRSQGSSSVPSSIAARCNG
jgi:hypothetical protein